MIGNLFIVSAPSGAGKTSLVNALVNKYPEVKLSVSHTTRAKRKGEEDGQDYFFVSKEKFSQLRNDAAFLESATVFDNSYGTLSEAVMMQIKAGVDVILEIDWQGAQQIRTNYPECVGIFILPPSSSTLEQRLRGRGQDNDDIIERRMRDAKSEMSHYVEFDYLIINDDFDVALQELVTIIFAQRSSITIQKQVKQNLLVELLA